ncbi:enteropeptidase [Salminus brasiliensis]|uniref:enteropeptidase n=1 Tax=Salminus brasiliensis TaxID=930266 RepID=UPI003B82CAF5
MCRRRSNWSSFEVLLTTTTTVLFIVCIGLIVVTWLTLDSVTQDQAVTPNSTLSGSLVISEGAVFTQELKNKSSVEYKALAFDTELLISEAFGRSSLKDHFRRCKVTKFSQGSVIVDFDLFFRDAVDSKSAEDELVSSVQSSGGLIIDTSSIQVSAVKCPDGQKACREGSTCVSLTHFCDGILNCPDGSDESERICATVCDGQFLLLGPSGFFHSKNFPQDYDSDTSCRWIIRVDDGFAIKIVFEVFQTEEGIDVLYIYEGTGPEKTLAHLLSGSSPGTVWLFSSEATVEFSSDFISNQQGFYASYWAENISQLSNEEKIQCSFEAGFCYWRQEHEDDGDWVRTSGSTFPPLTGPSFDHTLGNQSGFYIVTPSSPGSWEKIFRLYSLPLASADEEMCLRFWYHMYGVDVYRLAVMAERGSVRTILFQKQGNYGDNWNYGQITVNTADQTIVFEARKNGGLRNDVALDDFSLTSGPCAESPFPEPTVVPLPTTPPPVAPDCGGPFDLYEPNTTFSSPNYPSGYGNDASCLWTLHAEEGHNIQLHFQDFALEAAYDMVEVRDGVDPHSTLLGVLTGDRVFSDLFSTSSQMTVRFFSDASGNSRGFLANFSTGVGLGQPEPCQTGQYQCRSGHCVSSSSVCDGVVNCPEGSDEAYCVQLMPVNLTGAQRLMLQIQNNFYTACALDWNPQFSNFFCHHLGYRSGTASFLPQLDEDAPFAIVSLAANGFPDLKPSENCPGEKVVSLYCDNQPCGTRQITMKTASSSSEAGDTWVEEDGGGKNESSSGRVVGGQDALKGAWPWMASLKWTGRHVCGAAIIDREWLITAAHCVFGKNIHLSNWVVVLGLHAQYESDTSQRQYHLVDQVIMNPHYNRRTKDSDIALMHLQTRVNFADYIEPICLPHPDQQFEPGRRCVIAGWGRLTEGGAVADVMQQAVLPLLNNSQCQEWLPEYNITKRMVCAGYAEGGVDSCQGDSGGPLMCEGENHWVLAGVTSFGVGCAQPQRPGVYALVSEFIDWVVETRRLNSHWSGSR